jgi:plastocyanin
MSVAPTTRFQLSWTRLLLASAIADALVLLFLLVTAQDTLALVLAVALLAGLALLRFRGGLLGLLVLAGVFADTAFWTLPGAVANFANREPLGDLLLPAYLGLISLLGLAAAVGVYVSRRRGTDTSAAPVWLAGGTAAALVIVTVSGLLMSPFARPAVEASAVPLAAKNMSFSSTTLQAAGTQVTIAFTNEDLWWHTFTIDALGVNESVAMGAERAISFSAPPGQYHFYCAIPGHAAIGMQGTLTVTQP